MDTMGRVYYDLGVYDRAAGLVQEALTYRRSAPREPRQPAVATASTASARSLCSRAPTPGRVAAEGGRSTSARTLLGPESVEVAETLVVSAHCGTAWATGRRRRRSFVRRSPSTARLLGRDDLALATSLNNLAMVHQPGRRSSRRARRSTANRMAIRRKRLGNEHPFVAQSLNNIGMALRQAAQARRMPSPFQ